jgi:cyclase
MVYLGRTVEATHTFGASDNIKEKAKILRKRMTESEKLLLGQYFRRQHPISIYIVDFFCYECSLVIELDGEIHKFQKKEDIERTSDLESFGLKVIRFPNQAVFNDIENVIQDIKNQVVKLKQSPFHLGGKG